MQHMILYQEQNSHTQSLSLGPKTSSTSWFSLQSSWFFRLYSLVDFIKSSSNSWS